MKFLVGRTAIAACAGSLLLLASACGDADSKGSAKSNRAKKAQTSAEPKKTQSSTEAAPPSTAELKKLILQPGERGFEVKGDKDDDARKMASAYGRDTSGAITTDKPACKPLARAMAALPQGRPSAVTATSGIGGVPEKKKKVRDLEQGMEESAKQLGNLRIHILSLTSYKRGEGQRAIDALKVSALKCSGGFKMDVPDPSKLGKENDNQDVQEGKSGPAPVTSVTKLPGKWGDDGVAYTLKVAQNGATMPFHVAAVRKGPVVISLASLSMDMTGTGKSTLPTKTLEAQLAKLRN
ncbi:hypothetical protein ACQEU8_19185 [Streptomyces sp. CA-250714]|uniref:hypothetical protein n=1 Tax=Streptomyces sp. CA-250714 TaxID=3240060 RepID=UPI003D8E5802